MLHIEKELILDEFAHTSSPMCLCLQGNIKICLIQTANIYRERENEQHLNNYGDSLMLGRDGLHNFKYKTSLTWRRPMKKKVL